MWPQTLLLLAQAPKGLPGALPLPRTPFLSWYFARSAAASLTSLRAEALGKEEAAPETGSPLLGQQSPGKPPALPPPGPPSCSFFCGSQPCSPFPGGAGTVIPGMGEEGWGRGCAEICWEVGGGVSRVGAGPQTNPSPRHQSKLQSSPKPFHTPRASPTHILIPALTPSSPT